MEELNDFDSLCNELDGRIEDRTFDLKRDPPSVNDVVKEIQAGMNGLESCYRVIIGIDEGTEKKFDRTNIAPVAWPAGKGALADADTYRTAIDASLKASTSDYHEGYWLFKELPVSGGHILVVEALKSPYAPHQNTQDGRYYIRRAGSTSHMTAKEIQQALQGGVDKRPDPEASREPIRDGEFLADLKDHHWVPGANELRYAGGPQLHVRVSPLELRGGRFSGTYLKNTVKGLCPLGSWQSASHERVEDGFLVWRVESADNEKTGAFSKVFETGEIWAVDNTILAPSSDGSANIPGIIVPKVREAILQYGSVLQECLHMTPPYRAQVTLHDVKRARLHISTVGSDGRCLKDTVSFNAIWNREVDLGADDLCNEFAKMLWDACGLTLDYRIQFQPT